MYPIPLSTVYLFTPSWTHHLVRTQQAHPQGWERGVTLTHRIAKICFLIAELWAHLSLCCLPFSKSLIKNDRM